MRMDFSWTLLLLRLLGAVQWSWTWSPVRAPYTTSNTYLNAEERPLWILEDEQVKRQRVDRSEEDFSTTTRATTLFRMRQNRVLQPPPIRILVRPDAAPPPPPPPYPPSPRRVVLPHRLQMPSHYVQHNLQTKSFLGRKPKMELRRRQPQSLPIFDNAPGDNTLSATSYPIFVYNGTKGELLVNTMLSAQRYPMQEPVPGQILYPPSTPMFRPKPIVERFRLPNQRELLNLTLIPFYAHEAITLAPITTTTLADIYTDSATDSATDSFIDSATDLTTVSTTDTDPTELTTFTTTTDTASAPVPTSSTTPLTSPYETQLPASKRRRNPKKTKHYNAYYSPQEVIQRQPVLRGSPALPAPNNHRQHQLESNEFSENPPEDLLEEEELLDSEFEEELEMEEQQEQHEESTSNTSSLQIVYMDESLESPTDTLDSTTETVPQLHRQSSRYAMKREYFAFPVYTLGKLLHDPSSDKIKMGHIVELDHSNEHGETWFILNSRYKGPHRNIQNNNQSKYFTSKYIQHPKGTKR